MNDNNTISKQFFMSYISTWNWMILSLMFSVAMLFAWLFKLYGLGIGLFGAMVISVYSALINKKRIEG